MPCLISTMLHRKISQHYMNFAYVNKSEEIPQAPNVFKNAYKHFLASPQLSNAMRMLITSPQKPITKVLELKVRANNVCPERKCIHRKLKENNSR